MKRIFYLSFILVSFITTKVFSVGKEWISINETSPVKINAGYKSLPGNQSEITFNLPGFFKESRKTPRGEAYSITIPGGAKMLQAGMPDISQVAFSLIIPDAAEMKAEVIYSDYTDYNFSVAPSKGNLKRNVNPEQVPFTYSSVYSANEFFPQTIVALRNPYILRDYRGQTVVVNPMQYNPVTQTLRVYSTMTIRVSPTGNINNINRLNRRASVTSVDPSFALAYRKQFLNFSISTYTPVNEHGKMLVVSDAAFISVMQPFVNWKNKMGQPTEMVDFATIGTTAQQLKDYIADYYTNNGLTFVLIVGDGPQIPPFASQYGDSDPSYGYLLGSDSYPEVFVGRFSANNAEELQTQVDRTLTYEMHPDPAGQWYHKGVCIGSDQGPGDDNEMDFEHERNIRTDYLAYNYTTVDELFDGSQGGVDAAGDPNADDLNTSLNDGRGIITYTGHGSTTSLGTTGYNSSDVANLTNVNQLPFIWSVACVNGDFNNGTCLAEAFIRSKTPAGEPTGAIATFMSTINQSWDPPMDAQDEMVDILVESVPGNVQHTFGAISESGCMHMNDVYGSGGDEMTDTWVTFGDPSLTVRTNTPFPLLVSHHATIDQNQTNFTVNCPTNGAQICLSHNNQIISVSHALAGTAILAPTGLNVGDTLDLVATAYNAIPYFSQVIVTTPSSTGVNSITNNNFNLYPNPVKGMLSLTLNESPSDLSYRILNSIGQTVLIDHCLSAGNGSYQLDITSLPAGVYSVSVYNDSMLFGVKKVVIE